MIVNGKPLANPPMVRFRSVGGPIIGKYIFVSAKHNQFDVGDVTSDGRTVTDIFDPGGDIRYHRVDRAFTNWLPPGVAPTKTGTLVTVSGWGPHGQPKLEGNDWVWRVLNDDDTPTQRTGETPIYSTYPDGFMTRFRSDPKTGPPSVAASVHDSGGGVVFNGRYVAIVSGADVMYPVRDMARVFYITLDKWIEHTKKLRLPGDLNLDGKVDFRDLTLALGSKKMSLITEVLGNYGNSE